MPAFAGMTAKKSALHEPIPDLDQHVIELLRIDCPGLPGLRCQRPGHPRYDQVLSEQARGNAALIELASDQQEPGHAVRNSLAFTGKIALPVLDIERWDPIETR